MSKNIFKSFRNSLKSKSGTIHHIDMSDAVLEQALDIAEDCVSKRKKNEHIVKIIPTSKNDDTNKHDQSIVVIITEDRPFLIDSITAECVSNNHIIEGVLYDSFIAERTNAGTLKSITMATDKAPATPQENILIMALSGFYNDKLIKHLTQRFKGIIEDVKFATFEWHEMRQALQDTIKQLDETKVAKDKVLFPEYKAFLNYLYDNNFTLLGYREYKLSKTKKGAKSSIVKGAGLGLLNDKKDPAYIARTRQHLDETIQNLRMMQPTLTVAKINKRSTVHRNAPIDTVAIKTYDAKGNVTGERLFIGLFTSVTYSRSIQDIPFLRHKVNTVIEQTGFSFNSHNYRALMHILEKYPRDELFQIDAELLKEYVLSIMMLSEQPKVALYTRQDDFKRYISCLVYVPREKYETNLRVNIMHTLEDRMKGKCDSFHTVLDDSPLARVMYTIRIEEGTEDTDFDFQAIEDELIALAKSWEEKIESALVQHCETESQALDLTRKYKNAFPIGYQKKVPMEEAIQDIENLEKTEASSEFALHLYDGAKTHDDELRLKIYHPKSPVTLSDIMPIMENFGFNVIAEEPYEIRLADKDVWIHDFLIQYCDKDHSRAASEIKKIFEQGMTAIWKGLCENDELNALIPLAQKPWREVLILRTYIKYMRQTQIQYTPQYMMKALVENPNICQAFIDLFAVMHSPDIDNRDKQITSAIKSIEKHLSDVASYDQDKILRNLLQMVQNTMRTNFYQSDKNGNAKDYVSIKINSRKIDGLPLPKPAVEIFVYSPRTEGVHLRGGKIARGGLRWSDRHEDFRTEVLGLMKAQNVKNSVIVPVGSKGGFIVKNPPATSDRQAMQDEGIACYKIFIRGLLDITDNVKKTKIIPPKNVVRHDGDDPYLVVAADKGTATFSDIANGLSDEYGFWLGDAFASGGSAGYDHKAMGITARGAWESVKRHFRELGKDIQNESFDVMGVGDMAGDVFGNGMLLSRHIRLVGAFNHKHIFCDPNPDVENSYKERERLFKEVKGWDHYNEDCLSKGGRIYSRDDKSLKLTPEIQKRFGITKKEVSPIELMRAILTSQTDLIWFGGIGTYIKAPNESHADVGDKANDPIRIDAHEVQAKVIGEGANLGVTHSARICMALLGIKVYADFIDNSGGVNSSDLEVNIKILFKQIMQDGSLTVKARNKMLEKMTNDVAALVLRNNYQQTQAISMTVHNAADKLASHSSLIDYLENNFDLNRAVENLPDEQAIDQRGQNKQGLTAPELSTLISYTKIKLFQDLAESDLPDDPAFQEWMTYYFPTLLRKKYESTMDTHRLRKEIIATQLANSIVNRMGPTFMINQTSKTGADASLIARIYFIVREIFELRDLYDGIESLDNKIDAVEQIKALDSVSQFIDYTTGWFLSYFRNQNMNKETLMQAKKHYAQAVKKLVKSFDKALPETTNAFIENNKKTFVEKGFPTDIATKLAMLPVLNTTCDIIKISDEQNHDLQTVARVYFGLNEAFLFGWLRHQTKNIAPASRWESSSLEAINNRLYKSQAALTKRIVIESCSQKTCPSDPVQEWMEQGGNHIQSICDIIQDAKEQDDLDFAKLTSIELSLGNLH